MAVPGKGPNTQLFGEEGGKNILIQLNKQKVTVMTNHVPCTFMIWVRGTLFVYLVACLWALAHWASENEKLLVQQEIYLSGMNGCYFYQAL